MPTPRLVPTSAVRDPAEPMRVEMGDQPMVDLIDSIKELGILEPLLVFAWYASADGRECLTPDPSLGETGREPEWYEVIDGHRRLTAARYIELDTLPVMVFENAEQAKHAIMLHANVCREDVTPYEEGVQFLELATKHQWSMDQMVRFFRKSDDYINDRCDVVRKDQAVAGALRERRLNLGQAKEILKCEDPAFRAALLEQAVVHGATIQSLRVMRHNRLSEERAAQGELAINASPQFVPGGVIAEDKCVCCGEVPPPGNVTKVTVCTYHQRDLDTIMKRVGLRAFYAKEPTEA
jgi:ParB/RepB/Spo0J family partition protein